MKTVTSQKTHLYVFIASLLVVGLFAGQFWLTYRLINRDREQTIQHFIDEHNRQLRRAVDEGRVGLLDMLDPFEFLTKIVRGQKVPEGDGIEAVLRYQPGLHAVSIWGPRGQQIFARSSDVIQQFSYRQYDTDLQKELLRGALIDFMETPGRLGVSASKLDSSGRILRAFVRPTRSAGRTRYIGVLIDVKKAFEEIESLAKNIGAEFVVLGPDNKFEPMSTLDLTDFKSRKKASSIFQQMASKNTGVMRIGPKRARKIGLSKGEHVLTYDSFKITPKVGWTVGMLSSLEPARASVRSMMWRIGAISGVFSLLLFGIGGFLVYSIRARGRLQERLDHAREVAHLNAKADAILDAIPTAVVAVDEDLVVRELNAEMAAVLGDDAEGDRLDRRWESRTDSSFDPIETYLEQNQSSDKQEPQLLEPVDFGRGSIYFQLRAVPFPGEVDSEYVILAFDDVTGVKELESQLLRAEKLSTVGVLTAGVAHEIGTPLGVVKGRAEYALSKLDEGDPVEEHLSIIVEQSEYISSVVEQILDFSRDEQPDIRSTDIAEAVSRSIQLVTFQRDNESVEIETDIPDSLPPIAANPDEFQQVVVNLLMNAHQACQKEGHIRIAGRMEPGEESEEFVRIAVQDDGAGIDPENRHKIFDPFFTTKKRGRGTGLGLSVVQKIVRNHGGKIKLDSSPGEGTTFHLIWPVFSGKESE